ncbi:HAD family hydrolase [Salinarimonas ramus]|uniref:Haloacid dehalogenase n=1 Tax=Salinarimonas ramus TaxID=690164 RepID=A0A917Q8W0_9HYPH|nr:HAD-IA family hydrolase [Salinarimonas ramus]GGK35687.1 haloacid dehalogenase [Salinarimonas ramus]
MAKDTHPREPVTAALFDMDGVVTDTAQAHFAAWKETFDPVLARHGSGAAAAPFTQADYHAHVDGVPRLDGVRRLLAARGMALPEGVPGETDLDSVEGIAATKNRRFGAWLESRAVPAYPDTIALIRALRERGVRVGLFSASRNTARVLASAGVTDLFEAIVDGEVARALALPGKPDPAMPVEAARRLGAEPARAALFEDAVSGVEAGRRGGFGLVIGVDREAGAKRGSHAAALRASGADLVLDDLRAALPVLVPGAAIA